MSIALPPPADQITYICTYWSRVTGDCEEDATRGLSIEDRETLGPWLNTRNENCIRALCPEHLARMEAALHTPTLTGIDALHATHTDLFQRATLDATAQLARGRYTARMTRIRQDARALAADKFEADWRRQWPGLAALVDHAKEG